MLIRSMVIISQIKNFVFKKYSYCHCKIYLLKQEDVTGGLLFFYALVMELNSTAEID